MMVECDPPPPKKKESVATADDGCHTLFYVLYKMYELPTYYNDYST